MSNKSSKHFKKLHLFKDPSKVDNKLIRQLAKQPLFKNVPETILAKIAHQVKVHNLAKDEMLVRQGDSSESLFILRTGWVKVVTKDNEGEEVILNHVGPGQIIGEMALMDRKPRSNSVIVLRPIEVIEVGYDVILEVFDEHPILARSLLQEMFNRVRFANAYIEEMADWFRYIAAGKYDLVQQQVEQTQSTVVDMTKSDHARANAFLSVFFKMIEDVKTRELYLQQEVHRLTIQIDVAKRQEAVQELTDTHFFEELQDAAQKVRAERAAKSKKQSKQGDDGDSRQR